MRSKALQKDWTTNYKSARERVRMRNYIRSIRTQLSKIKGVGDIASYYGYPRDYVYPMAASYGRSFFFESASDMIEKNGGINLN